MVDDDLKPDDLEDDCICDFGLGESCGGLGTLYCEGCGGDLCICACGGEVDCPGCTDCDAPPDDDQDEGGEA